MTQKVHDHVRSPTLAMKAEVSMMAEMCLSQPAASSLTRKSFMEGFFSSDTETDDEVDG